MGFHLDNVRTILYVYKDGGITVEAGADAVVVERYPGDDVSLQTTISANTTKALSSAGIYRINQSNDRSKFHASINGGDVISVDVKDDYPDPTVGNAGPTRFSEQFSVTYDELKDFDPAVGAALPPADQKRQ